MLSTSEGKLSHLEKVGGGGEEELPCAVELTGTLAINSVIEL